jgi:hypothetical protein
LSYPSTHFQPHKVYQTEKAGTLRTQRRSAGLHCSNTIPVPVSRMELVPFPLLHLPLSPGSAWIRIFSHVITCWIRANFFLFFFLKKCISVVEIFGLLRCDYGLRIPSFGLLITPQILKSDRQRVIPKLKSAAQKVKCNTTKTRGEYIYPRSCTLIPQKLEKMENAWGLCVKLDHIFLDICWLGIWVWVCVHARFWFDLIFHNNM